MAGPGAISAAPRSARRPPVRATPDPPELLQRVQRRFRAMRARPPPVAPRPRVPPRDGGPAWAPCGWRRGQGVSSGTSSGWSWSGRPVRAGAGPHDRTQSVSPATPGRSLPVATSPASLILPPVGNATRGGTVIPVSIGSLASWVSRRFLWSCCPVPPARRSDWTKVLSRNEDLWFRSGTWETYLDLSLRPGKPAEAIWWRGHSNVTAS